ncbi:hypothetical protein [Streptomyces flavofungini]|uniref:Uncharacterized protein n=1 Tax=Streptomyces flavofungini TaxID=68200 RepID=A0ABS0X9R5_9ACTN|nr:hypothetical protein [Streptomyces flavofungini]MBJ3809889.1 hypothetical protein [Streptomyces flavofungini]GHC54290.1 hypothetical protein GCM10010349_20790 [Streptomyces flavofungini]
MASYRSELDPYGALSAAGREETAAGPGLPGDPSGREATRRGLTLVRAYARGDAAGVAAALDGADPAVARQLPAVTGDILRLVIGIVLSAPRTLTPADVVRTADTIAAVGPPHHELAVSQAVRAWADGDDAGLRGWWQDGAACAHGAAVLAAALAVGAWGRAAFLGLLETFDEVVAACG